MELSIFNRFSDKKACGYAAFNEIVKNCHSPIIAQKQNAPLFLCCNSTYKKKEDVKKSAFSILVVDIDSEEYEANDLKYALSSLDCNYVCYSTASSMISKKREKPIKRWRIVIELAEPVSKDKWQQMQKGLMYVFDGSDRAMLNPTQLSYLPLKNESTVHYEFFFDTNKGGLSFSKQIELQQCAILLEEEEREIESKALVCTPPAVNKADGVQTDEAYPHERVNPISVFNMYNCIHDLLAGYGFKRIGANKYLHPHSQSGNAGVIVFNEGKGYYSHHSNDELYCGDDRAGAGNGGRAGGGNGTKAFDAFHVFRFWEHGGDLNSALKDAGNRYLVTSLKNPNARSLLTISEWNQRAYNIAMRVGGAA